jgi:hypothetical protein
LERDARRGLGQKMTATRTHFTFRVDTWNDLRVVTNVDHNVHTILYPKRIAIVHHSPSLRYVG